jgi:hypothetical protein
MSINKLCTKFKISDELWKSVINNIRHHLLFDELFPKSEENSGFVTKVLQDHDLCKRDDSGLIYSTVCLLFDLLVPEPFLYVLELFYLCSRTLLFQVHHQITVSRSHIREVFEAKYDLIFEDIKFPVRDKNADIIKQRQDVLQPLRANNKFIYSRGDNGKFVKPFTSQYIQKSLEFLLFGKKPRFAKILKSGEYINCHVIAVICTFVRIFYYKACPRTPLLSI